MAKQMDALENEQPGVGVVKDKRLNSLADSFCDDRDAKAELATKMTATEAKIIERMQELGVTIFRYSDREVRLKAGKNHVKVKTVKVDGEGEGD